MRRTVLLSGLVLVGGLLGPSTALAAEDDGTDRWIAVEDQFAIVLPDGQTFTDDGTTRGDEVGRSHIECTAQVVELHFLCDVAFVLDAGSQLHGTVAVDFGGEQTEEFELDIPVTVTASVNTRACTTPF